MQKRSRARLSRGVKMAGSPEGRTRALPLDILYKGGAARARPEYRRMMSASDRRRLAPPGVYPRPDCSGRDQDRPREWFSQGSGTDPDAPHPARHVRHRPGPASAPRTQPFDWARRNPARWLALHGPPERAPPASGTPMASTSSRCLPHVTANPERPSSRLVQHVRDPSGSGSAGIMAWGMTVGTKSG